MIPQNQKESFYLESTRSSGLPCSNRSDSFGSFVYRCGGHWGSGDDVVSTFVEMQISVKRRDFLLDFSCCFLSTLTFQ